MNSEIAVLAQPDTNAAFEARMIDLVLHGVTSGHSLRSYRTGLTAFFAWMRMSGAERRFRLALKRLGK